MAKLGIFVGVYSIILLILFGVFCYLITTVNPPPKGEETKRYGGDDYVYANELSEKDNVHYGLEKVDYDVSIDSLKRRSNNVDKCKKSTSKIYIDKTSKTNRKKEELKRVTKSMKHIKGLRRSINNENQEDYNLRRTIHLKIKDLSGHPKIEIKVLPEKCHKESRKSRSSSNVTNITNNNVKVIDNFTGEVLIDLVRNETIVLDFMENFINPSDPNNTNEEDNKEEDIFLNSYVIGDIDDKKVYETSPRLYTVDLLKTNVDYQLHDRNDITVNNFDNSSADYGLIGNDNDTKLITFLFNPVTNKNETDLYRFYNSTTKPLQNHNAFETIPSDSAKSLVGLLIPEATATQPYNDHV